MPCCDDGCGPSLTAARPGDPAAASAKIRLDPPSWTAILPQTIELPAFSGVLAMPVSGGAVSR
jgi:hypothetical protein